MMTNWSSPVTELPHYGCSTGIDSRVGWGEGNCNLTSTATIIKRTSNHSSSIRICSLKCQIGSSQWCNHPCKLRSCRCHSDWYYYRSCCVSRCKLRSLAKIDCPIRGQECYNRLYAEPYSTGHQSEIHQP